MHASQANMMTLDDFKRDTLKYAVFTMRTSQEKNMHKDYATYMVDTIIHKIQPFFKTTIDGTLFTCGYVHKLQSFTYSTASAIVDEIAKHATAPLVVEHEDGSFYELTYNPDAVITSTNSIEWEQVTYGWLETPPGLLTSAEQMTGARQHLATETHSPTHRPILPTGPLCKYMREKMRLGLDTRVGAVHQAVDKKDNAKLPRYRFQFTENSDFAPFFLLKYHSGDFTLDGYTIPITLSKAYTESHSIHAPCRRWLYTEKEMTDFRTPRHLVCTCGARDKYDKGQMAEKKASAAAARKRKLERMQAGTSANPFTTEL